MGSEPLSGDITLNGIKYTLPVKAQSLVDNGWDYNNYDDKGHPLNDGYYVDNIHMDDGSKSEESRIDITLYNISGSKVNFEDAMLGAIEVTKKNDSYKNTVVLPKGITLSSTYEDIINAYGKPTTDFINEASWIEYYVSGSGNTKYGQELKFEFDKNTKAINLISLKNIQE